MKRWLWPMILLAAGFAVQMSGVALAALPPGSTDEERAFLQKNATAEGVVTLPGLQYKVLKSGPADGPHPLRSDEIKVRYEGRFIDGKVFNTSPDAGVGETDFPLQKLIPGWIGALQMMRPGDVWMLYIPAYLAYGAAGKTYIPPNSTLIFRVELVAVSKPQPEKP
ncbi:FKBP-type peptidyl-prolyl cis-trans isomerase [Caulobacter sp. S45]|uniref:FKBP-type peptidyl-prolyl cis-trans isomerase n=1 Tax=Caulobacter sp. S45 TaxID=1641861 RepID=UPI0020B10517|nr:FKBP-type peptidyl-prolyl cis-trans isomerase [Caulobacter sp. S45]